ncbi:MAG: chorismate mutase, partial [Alphaproteobacteria bacterium]
MSQNKSMITRVQNQINAIDSEILTLLARRFEAVKALSVHENISENDIFYRPDRESMMMRRIFAQNNRVLPVQSLLKIMREIISVEEQLHKPFSIAVYTKECGQDMLELSKDYFGTNGRYIPCLSLGQAIQKVNAKEAGVAVLPLFEQAEESWWTALSSGTNKELKIVAKLPFLKKSHTVSGKEAFVIGTAEF